MYFFGVCGIKGAALTPPPCPTPQAARARFAGGTLKCLRGAVVATGLGCRALPDALSNDRLPKTFARAPTLPPPQHNPPARPPAPEKIFALRTSLTPTLRRRLVAIFSPWTACRRSASMKNTDVINMTERNFGTCSRPVGKLRSVSKAWPQPQTANIKLGCSRARARKRRTHKTTARPFGTLATKPGAKRKRQSELACLFFFGLERWVSAPLL